MVDGRTSFGRMQLEFVGSGNGSCRKNGCGAGMCVSDVHTGSRVAWHTVHKNMRTSAPFVILWMLRFLDVQN